MNSDSYGALLSNRNGSASLPGQAPFMRLYLRIGGDNVIEQASFVTFGCAAAIACGSMITELIKGRTVTECRQLDRGRLANEIGHLPEERQFCIDLAIAALACALKQI
jgi:NifU-like protein involved in Fe-S cluster formation